MSSKKKKKTKLPPLPRFRRNRDYSGSREEYIKKVLQLADRLDDHELFKVADKVDKVLYNNEWLQLKETSEGYIYSHESRCNGHIVAMLVIDPSRREPILGRYERTPAHYPGAAEWKDVPLELASITGGVDKGMTPREAAVMETKEEAGYKVTDDDLIDLGTVKPSKSADTIVHLYAVEVKDQSRGDAEGDGSKGEQDAYCDWVSVDSALQSKDPLLSALVTRYFMLD